MSYLNDDEDEEEDDLEIIPDTIISNKDFNLAKYHQELHEDIEDLQFYLKKHEKRVKELFPTMTSIYELQEKELKTLKSIISKEIKEKEESQLLSNNNTPKLTIATTSPVNPGVTMGGKLTDSLIEKKRKAENSLLSSKPTKTNQLPSSSSSSLSSSSTTAADRKKNPLLYGNPFLNPSSSSSTSTKPIPKVWKGVENMKYVNGSLINMQTLLKNAPKTLPNQHQPTSSSSSSTVAAATSTSTRQPNDHKTAALLSEIDNLLSQKSSHNQEANQEWHDNFNKKCINLEKQEYKAKLQAERTANNSFYFLSGYDCHTCSHFLTELYPTLCQERGHFIEKITIMKRFFLCRSCNRKDFTLTNGKSRSSTNSGSGSSNGSGNQPTRILALPPKHNCKFCGKDDWMIVGGSSSGGSGSSAGENSLQSLVGEKLITSASEWTSRQDKLNMATRVSNLDK